MVKSFAAHPDRITEWSEQRLSDAPDMIVARGRKAEASSESIEQFHVKISPLTMENEFFYEWPRAWCHGA